MSEYFPQLRDFGGNVNDELDLFNYVTIEDFKNTTGLDTSKFA